MVGWSSSRFSARLVVPLAIAVASSAAASSLAPADGPPPARGDATAKHVLLEARSPPFSDGIFPCTQCHRDQKDRTRRELAFHDEQQSIFAHDREHRWCLDCHDYENRDVLRLVSGETVPFTESYRLCGQCHGDKVRSWRSGVHGKRVGRWDGEKTYFLCVNCHNPHAPLFKGVAEVVAGGKRTVAPTQTFLKPEPRPLRPEEQRR
jgi:hypothetical protein